MLLFSDNRQGRRSLALKESQSDRRNCEENDAHDDSARPVGKTLLFIGRQNDVDAWAHAKFSERGVRLV
jgi:hypothetical protein